MPRFPHEIDQRAPMTFPNWLNQNPQIANPRAQLIVADALMRATDDAYAAQRTGVPYGTNLRFQPAAAGPNPMPPAHTNPAGPTAAARPPAAARGLPPPWARNEPPPPPPPFPGVGLLVLSTSGLLASAIGVTLYLTAPAAPWVHLLLIFGGLSLCFFVAAWIVAHRPVAQPLTEDFYRAQATAARAQAGGADLPLDRAERAQYRSGVDVHHPGRTPQTAQAMKPLCQGWDVRRSHAALNSLRNYLSAAMRQPATRAKAELAKQTLDGPPDPNSGFDCICSPHNMYQMQDMRWPTAHVCAMLWDKLNHYTAPQGDSEQVRSLLRQSFMHALADARHGYHNSMACPPGQIQRLALVLQGYFPEIQIDPVLRSDKVAPAVYVIGPTNKFMREHPPAELPADPLQAQRAQSGDLFYRRQLWDKTNAAAQAYYQDDPQRETLCREVRQLLADFFRYNYDDLVGFNPTV